MSLIYSGEDIYEQVAINEKQIIISAIISISVNIFVIVICDIFSGNYEIGAGL